MKGSREHVAVYLEAADSTLAPLGWKRFVDFRLGVVAQQARRVPMRSPTRTPPRPRRVGLHPGKSFSPGRREQPECGDTKSVWRAGSHEFNSETSDGTWGFSQARALPSDDVSAPSLTLLSS